MMMMMMATGWNLGEFDVSINKIGEVGEVEAEGELVVKPARLVKVRSWNQAIDLFFFSNGF